MPVRAVIASTPLASQSVVIGDYWFLSVYIIIYSEMSKLVS